ncbi:MAG: hypothetical protein KDI61_12450 [Alphaproteobacteria bacterium]|nr:hypothetical protein [Alphaproteobacteria bacterium]
MKKEGLLLKIVVRIFYGIGGFWLANLILLGFFLNFIVDLIPECGWAGWELSYIHCGQSFYSKLLSSYFMTFTPFVAFFLLIVSIHYMQFPYYPLLFVFPVTLFFLILVYIVPFTAAYELLKRLSWRRRDYSPQQRRTAFLCLCLILLPTFSTGLLKLYIEPPWFINRTITVDLWQADLKIERRYLDKWSLVYPFPKKLPHVNNFTNFIPKAGPFARIEVSYSNVDPSFNDEGRILMKITPHRAMMTETELSEKRQKYFEYESKKWSAPKPAGRYLEFEIFERQLGGWPDFYIHKNAQGQIENILECTPDTHCVTPFGRGWNQKPCKNEEECKSCLRVCTDKSLGTGMLNIEYTFDKKYLESYFALNQAVLDFVAAHTVAKEK